MVVPPMFLILFVIFIPILVSLYYACTNYSGMASNYKWIGLKNFIDIFTKDALFWRCLYNALSQAFWRILLLDTFCVVMAILLDYISGRMERVYRVLFFIPCTLTVVIVAKLWTQMYNPTYGLVNKVFKGLSLAQLAHNWLSDPNTALIAVHFMIIWSAFGWTFLYYYAGVKSVSEDLYEAALIDGCGRFRMYLNITLPLLKPVIAVCITMDLIASLKQMEIIMLSTGGGPGGTTMFLANYIYNSHIVVSTKNPH